ncbi:hypothetical protein RB623_27490 [Mesorhizobium sp. LHD-90]|uniref:hypothetical protein n=1 Tax=Mesorhizobium sp. LHD-90 TaxID=3071414 RepID=UPI0027DF00CE|nr:hypothetical protein [Mesorhizobium sp. LHD-90]MDQ6437814.1 hypothetical protein [Mesorhizobium sp. LHD-90]
MQGARMEILYKDRNIADMDAFMDAQDDRKTKLIDRRAIHESVSYLKNHGFDAEEVQRCLVRYFYVDLDLLHEALTEH